MRGRSLFLVATVALAVGRVYARNPPAYTNHAGLAVAGVPLRLEERHVTLSNAQETVRVPLSIFPEAEKRRLAADCGSTRFVPQEVRLALDGLSGQLHRVEARFAKDLITREQRDGFRVQAADRRREYLDRAVGTGRITERERHLLDSD